MKKIYFVLSLLLFSYSILFAAEEITITTYYPSPYGSYNALQTDKLGVGDNSAPVGLDSADVPTDSGDVWIKGRVSIGTTVPPVLPQPPGKLQILATGEEGIWLKTPNTEFRVYEDADSAGFIRVRAPAGNGMIFNVGCWGCPGGDSDHLSIITGGDVGIGTSSPNYKLDVRGSIGNNTTLYHSDARWKEDVKIITDALDKVLKLKGVEFKWKRDQFPAMNFDSNKHLGFIAQEVESIVPEVVGTNKEGFKTVEYPNLVALLVEAIKEQNSEIEGLKKKIDDIEKLIKEPDSKVK